MNLGVIDYGAGNLHSVVNVLKSIGYEAQLISSGGQFADASLTHLILPGVGSFGDSMEQVRSRGLEDPIKNWIATDRPFFGICVGYQMLFESSEESPEIPGLGVFDGQVKRFQTAELKVPHMGWNSVELKHPESKLWSGLPEVPYFYFVHSFFPDVVDKNMVAASCDYGGEFAAVIQKGKLIACQCHPEKSQSAGQQLLKNFLETA